MRVFAPATLPLHCLHHRPRCAAHHLYLDGRLRSLHALLSLKSPCVARQYWKASSRQPRFRGLFRGTRRSSRSSFTAWAASPLPRLVSLASFGSLFAPRQDRVAQDRAPRPLDHWGPSTAAWTPHRSGPSRRYCRPRHVSCFQVAAFFVTSRRRRCLNVHQSHSPAPPRSTSLLSGLLIGRLHFPPCTSHVSASLSSSLGDVASFLSHPASSPTTLLASRSSRCRRTSSSLS